MNSIEFFFDPACPFAWLTSRWVTEVAEQTDLQVQWRLIALKILNEGNDVPEQYARGHAASFEMLRVVDEQQLDPGALGVQQCGVDCEGLERGADQLGRAQRRHRRLRRGHTDGAAEQHHLFVDLREPGRRHPLRAPGLAPDAAQVRRIDAAFGAARQQVPQFRGEPGGGQRRPQVRRPVDTGVVAVLEVTGQQLADDAVLLGAGDQPRRRVTGTLGGLPQHGERVGVQRAHQRLTRDLAGIAE